MPTPLVNVSNRLPVTVGADKITKSSGGLVAALAGLSADEYSTKWISEATQGKSFLSQWGNRSVAFFVDGPDASGISRTDPPLELRHAGSHPVRHGRTPQQPGELIT